MNPSRDLFSIGPIFVSDFLAPDEAPRSNPVELRLVMDQPSGLVHLAWQAAPELMWGERYWYRSGTSATMRTELHDVVCSVEHVVDVGEGEVWVDIASNDGTLLSNVDTPDGRLGRVRVGVDPSGGSFADEARRHADLIVQESFSLEVAERIIDKYGRAKVVTCVAMFYDLMDPGPFLWGVRQLLAPDGVFVLQLAYAPLMLRQLAFDAICHEHARYYSLTTLREVLGQFGFRVLDVTLNDVNGGSMRVVAVHENCDDRKVGAQPWRDVARYRTDALIEAESADGSNTPERWLEFWHDANVLREEVSRFIRDAVRNGRTVWGLGASTKGNTLLQWFGLDSTLIEGIAERQEQKFGLRTVGTDIPIFPEEVFRAAQPDFALVLPWHFISELRHREAAYLAAGGRLLVPCPRFSIVEGL